jgi:membrane-bound metal-dependent hydrolase YbcI (DUF457 family)
MKWVTAMTRFWCALTVTLYFYARIDILIWQRIFEAKKLADIGVGIYHQGYVQVLFGFMLLGALMFYPDLRRMVTFPLSLAVLAFSGLEDILYYWLDGRSIPALLPWLNSNPFILRPVTADRLVISASFWLCMVVCVELAGIAFEFRNSHRKQVQNV